MRFPLASKARAIGLVGPLTPDVGPGLRKSTELAPSPVIAMLLKSMRDCIKACRRGACSACRSEALVDILRFPQASTARPSDLIDLLPFDVTLGLRKSTELAPSPFMTVLLKSVRDCMDVSPSGAMVVAIVLLAGMLAVAIVLVVMREKGRVRKRIAIAIRISAFQTKQRERTIYGLFYAIA